MTSVDAMLARLIGDYHQDQWKREYNRAKADPVANKRTRVFDPDARMNYRYYGGKKNGRGQVVRFCWATQRNAAGYFLTWREVRGKRGGKRDMWTAHKLRRVAQMKCERRFDAWYNKQTTRLAKGAD